jgi:hypothetical protein
MQRLFLAFSRIFASGSTLKPFSKSLAWLLLAAVSAGSLAAHQLPLMDRPRERAAGCHEHGQKTPPPEPVSYRCCVVGHGSALLEVSYASRPTLLATSPRILFPEHAITATLDGFQDPLMLSGDPPGNNPLRI